MAKSDMKLTPKRILLIGAIVILLLAAVLLLTGRTHPKQPAAVTAVRLGCTDNGSMKLFGNRMLYYDGSSLYCITSSGAEAWRFDIGADAWYDCSDTDIAIWRGSSLFVLNAKGESTYSDSLGEPIQFARIGQQYVGAVIGNTTSPRLVVKDLTGAHMDEESDAYQGLIMMDIGFYGNKGQYMWTLATDVFGTSANTILNTYEVGKTSATAISLGSNIPYSVVYDSSLLNVITTRKIRVFNDKHTEDTAAAKLVYGWTYLCHESGKHGTAYLFAPEPQTNSGNYRIEELRYLLGDTDRRLSLPETCCGAALYGGSAYAFSSRTLYAAKQNDIRFQAYELPAELNITSLIGFLKDGKAVAACNEDLYVLTLP